MGAMETDIQPCSPIFPSPEAKIRTYSNLMRRPFWPMQVKAGVSVPALDQDDGLVVWDEEASRSERRSMASTLCATGAASLRIKEKIDLKRLKTWMGHAGVQTTIDTYGDFMFDYMADAELMTGADKRLFG